MSGQQLHRSLEPEQAMGLATVYRNLRQLQQRGLVRCRHLPNGEALYAPLERDRHHLTCVDCGKTQALDHCPIHDLEVPKTVAKASISCFTRLNSLVSAATAASGSKARHDPGRHVLRSQWLVARIR